MLCSSCNCLCYMKIRIRLLFFSLYRFSLVTPRNIAPLPPPPLSLLMLSFSLFIHLQKYGFLFSVGFGSSSEVPHFSYATSSGFQTSDTDSRTFTSVSAHTSGSVVAFSTSSVPEIAVQLLDSYTTSFVHKEEKAIQGPMNMIENPLPGIVFNFTTYSPFQNIRPRLRYTVFIRKRYGNVV